MDILRLPILNSPIQAFEPVSPIPAINDVLSKPNNLINLPMGTILNGTIQMRDQKNNLLINTAKGLLVVNSPIPMDVGNEIAFKIIQNGKHFRAELVSINGENLKKDSVEDEIEIDENIDKNQKSDKKPVLKQYYPKADNSQEPQTTLDIKDKNNIKTDRPIRGSLNVANNNVISAIAKALGTEINIEKYGNKINIGFEIIDMRSADNQTRAFQQSRNLDLFFTKESQEVKITKNKQVSAKTSNDNQGLEIEGVSKLKNKPLTSVKQGSNQAKINSYLKLQPSPNVNQSSNINSKTTIETSIGKIDILDDIAIKPETKLILKIIEFEDNNNISPNSDNDMISSRDFSKKWYTLENIYNILKNFESKDADKFFQFVPKIDRNFTFKLINYLNLLKNYSIEHNFEPDFYHRITNNFEDVSFKKFENDFQFFKDLARQEFGQDKWNFYSIPLFYEEYLSQINILIRRDKEDELVDEVENSRIIVELELTKLGPLQLDIFLRRDFKNNNKDLIMIIRHKLTLPQNFKNEVKQIFCEVTEGSLKRATISLQQVEEFNLTSSTINSNAGNNNIII